MAQQPFISAGCPVLAINAQEPEGQNGLSSEADSLV